MLYGVQAQELPGSLPATLGAVQMDNSTTSTGVVKDSQTISDSALLTVSMWVKFGDVGGFLITSFNDFNSYFGYGLIFTTDVGGAFMDAALAKYFQFGSANGIAQADGNWHHFFSSVDTNHAAGAKLFNLYWDGTSQINAGSTVDSDTAFNIGFNAKPFGVPANSTNLGSQGMMSFSDVWIAPGVYLTSSDITKFRTVDGKPVDLGANGETPTGSSPAYFFHGDATTFATNLGSGGSVTLVGSLVSVSGPVT